MSIYRGRTRKDFYLTSALYDSIEDRNTRAIDLLVTKKGADPNLILPKYGISPLHLIIGNESKEFATDITKFLLQHGGDPNVQSDDGLTPLHIAAAWGRYEIVELLLCCGGDADVQDSNGFTPLDYSIEYGHSAVTDLVKDFSMPVSIFFRRPDDSLDYDFTLDKIFINNGYAVGEYKAVERCSEENSGQNPIKALDYLPEFKTHEYVENWFKEHLRKLSISSENNNLSTKIENENGSSVGSTFSDESDKMIQNAFSTTNVNCKPRNNQVSHFVKDHIATDESTIRSNSVLQNYKTKKKNYEEDSFCKYHENIRESGIITLPDNSIEYTENNMNTLNNPLELSKVVLPNSIANNTKTNQIKVYEVKTASNADEPNVIKNNKVNAKDTSSDYFTCNEVSSSISLLEKNIFEITSDLSSNCQLSNNMNSNVKENIRFLSTEITNLDNHITNIPCQISDNYMMNSCESRESIVSISEVYKYTDKEDGIVLYEKRLLVNTSSESNGSKNSISTTPSTTPSSKLSSLPASLDYDTDILRKELVCSGFNPGPITKTTKHLYLRKLHRLRKEVTILSECNIKTEKVFSMELEKTFRNPIWLQDLTDYKSLEDSVSIQFSCSDHKRKWREGVNKSSFTYLLLDPRITNNLPCRADILSPEEVWKTFLSSIFYVGKGKRSRPYSHLYEAVNLWNSGQQSSTSKKIQHILDIWKEGKGVVCLHLFQNVIPVEAYTREAAMISALKLENLENIKGGEYYGIASTWTSQQKHMLGVYLLYKAMRIFLNEGERQLSPGDID